MTGSPPHAADFVDANASVQTKITVADPQRMVSLLGSHDEILKLVERAVRSDIHVRGNEITISGEPAENAKAERIFAELLELIEKGETLTADAVRRTVGMLEQGATERPAEVLTLNILSRAGARSGPRRWARSATSTRSTSTRSCSASARPVPARRTWRWPRRCSRCRPSR
jgi:phosphate starvation-inducible PhoH-like protein